MNVNEDLCLNYGRHLGTTFSVTSFASNRYYRTCPLLSIHSSMDQVGCASNAGGTTVLAECSRVTVLPPKYFTQSVLPKFWGSNENRAFWLVHYKTIAPGRNNVTTIKENWAVNIMSLTRSRWSKFALIETKTAMSSILKKMPNQNYLAHFYSTVFTMKQKYRSQRHQVKPHFLSSIISIGITAIATLYILDDVARPRKITNLLAMFTGHIFHCFGVLKNKCFWSKLTITTNMNSLSL